jgi:hypothetical protein
MDTTKDIVAPVVAAVLAGAILAVLGWLYAQRTFVYRMLQPMVAWFQTKPWRLRLSRLF